MGTEQQMFARESWTKDEFILAVQSQLGTTRKLEATPLGLSDWEVRAGFVYDVRETRKIKLHFQDVDGKKSTIEVPGNKEVEDIQAIFRAQWGSPPWVKIHIKRQDDKAFFMEDGGKYLVLIEYVPEEDPRPEVKL
jgi:hypothetical protein